MMDSDTLNEKTKEKEEELTNEQLEVKFVNHLDDFIDGFAMKHPTMTIASLIGCLDVAKVGILMNVMEGKKSGR